MRKGETERIKTVFSDIRLQVIDAGDEFLAALPGITDPEAKRKVIGERLIRAKQAKPNVAVSAVLKEGNPAGEIVNAAKENGADAIVIGHRGLAKTSEFFLGSISEKVAHSAPCTVIIVK